MPKAYDDESEFEAEVYRDLAKLTLRERIIFLIGNIRLAFPLLISIVALFFSIAVVTVSLKDQGPGPAGANPLSHMGERLSSQALRIHRANETIKEIADRIQDRETREALLEQQRLIEEEVVTLKAYADGWIDRSQRSFFEFISTAYAQSLTLRISVEEVRLYGIISILVTLGIAFVLCIGIILFSDHAKRLTFAFDTVKVLMGFFVGVATSFFGVR